MTIKKMPSGKSGVIKCEKFVFAPKGNKIINFGYSLGGKDEREDFAADNEDKRDVQLKELAQVPVFEPVAELVNVAEDGGVPVVDNADLDLVSVNTTDRESVPTADYNAIDSIARPKTPDNQVIQNVASPNTPVEVKKMRGLVISEDGVMTMPSVHYYKLRRWEADLAVKEQQLKEIEHNLHVLVENSKQSVIAEANEAMGRFMAQETALRDQLLMEFSMMRDHANVEFNRAIDQERQEKMMLMKEIEYLRKAQFREMLETGDGNNVNEYQYANTRINQQQYNRVDQQPLYYKSMDCEPIISSISSHSNSSFPPLIHPMQHIYAREQPVQMAEVVQEGKSGGGGGVIEYLKDIPAKLVGSMLFGSVGTRSPPKKAAPAQSKPDLSKLIGSSGNGDLPPTASLHDIFNPSNANYSETKPVSNSMSEGGMSRKRSEPERSTIKPTADNSNAKPAVAYESSHSTSSSTMITTDAVQHQQVTTQTPRKRKRIQKQKQRPMIECKTFVFKPTNNGVVNFSYKLMFDEEMMGEAEEQFAIMKSKPSASVKNASVKKTNKSDQETITRALDRDDDGKREAQSPLTSNLEKTAETIQNVHESDTNTTQNPNPDVVVCEEKQLIMRKPSIPKRRHVRTLMPSTLSPIPEETEKELAVADQEKWFLEEFCEGFMPPSEDLDDWSLPSDRNTVKKTRIDDNKQESKPKLPFRVEVDEKGRKSYVMTDEVRQKLMASPQYKEHIKRKQQLLEAKKTETLAEKPEDEKAPRYAENMAKFEEKLKKTGKDGSSHLSSAGAIEIPVKKLIKSKDTKGDVGVVFTSNKPENDSSESVDVDSEIRVSKRIAGKIDFNQFKRPRCN